MMASPSLHSPLLKAMHVFGENQADLEPGRNQKIPRRLLPTGSAGALLIAGGVVGYFEGTENTAYLDPVGIPTVCTGHTGAEVRAGERLSDERCDALLKEDLGEAFTALKSR